MASTLTNFGVPVNQDGPVRNGIQMPKPKHKFRVLAQGFAGGLDSVDFSKNIMTASRPNVSSSGVAVHSYNSIAYYASKPEWQPLNIELRDDVCGNVSRLVGIQEQRQMNHRNQTTPMSASFYKFKLNMQALDGGDTRVLEDWVIEGCFLETIDYTSWDYSSSDPITISLTIRFDNAYLEKEYPAEVDNFVSCTNSPMTLMTSVEGPGVGR